MLTPNGIPGEVAVAQTIIVMPAQAGIQLQDSRLEEVGFPRSRE
jgi:hypothetical protein